MMPVLSPTTRSHFTESPNPSLNLSITRESLRSFIGATSSPMDVRSRSSCSKVKSQRSLRLSSGSSNTLASFKSCLPNGSKDLNATPRRSCRFLGQKKSNAGKENTANLSKIFTEAGNKEAPGKENAKALCKASRRARNRETSDKENGTTKCKVSTKHGDRAAQRGNGNTTNRCNAPTQVGKSTAPGKENGTTVCKAGKRDTPGSITHPKDKRKKNQVQSPSPEFEEAAVITLSDWVIKPVLDLRGVCVEGQLRGQDDFWHSSAIADIREPRLVVTESGSVYKLDGCINKLYTLECGFSKKVMSAFVNGFPQNWRDIIDDFYQSLETNSAVPTMVPKEKSRCVIDKTQDEEEGSDPNSILTPIGLLKREMNVNELPKTRSGRMSLPPLASWVGQRYVLVPDTNSVEVSFTTDAARKALVRQKREVLSCKSAKTILHRTSLTKSFMVSPRSSSFERTSCAPVAPVAKVCVEVSKTVGNKGVEEKKSRTWTTVNGKLSPTNSYLQTDSAPKTQKRKRKLSSGRKQQLGAGDGSKHKRQQKPLTDSREDTQTNPTDTQPAKNCLTHLKLLYGAGKETFGGESKKNVGAVIKKTVDGASKKTVNRANKETVDGASKKTVNRASKKTVNGASKETVDGANKKTVDGASKKTVDGASKETVNGANKETVDGASKKTVNRASKKTVDGASKKTVNRASKKTMNPASKETVDGASKETQQKKDTEKGGQPRGKKGTLKRRRELREFLDEQNKGYEDDVFNATPFVGVKRQRMAPDLSIDFNKTDSDIFGVNHNFFTPVAGRNPFDTPGLRLKAYLASVKKTPANQMGSTSLDATGLGDDRLKHDVYIKNFIDKKKKPVPSKEKQSQNKTVLPPMKSLFSGRSPRIFLETHDEGEEDGDGEDDDDAHQQGNPFLYYWSDND